jgi:hypothetical protein
VRWLRSRYAGLGPFFNRAAKSDFMPEQGQMPSRDFRLHCCHAAKNRGEGLVNVDRHVAGDLFSSWANKLPNPMTRTPDRVAHFKLFWFSFMYCYSFFFGCADAFCAACVNAYTTNCFVFL